MIINDEIYSPNEHNLTQQNLNSHLEIVKKLRNHNENRIKYPKKEGKAVLNFDYSENILLPILINISFSLFSFFKNTKHNVYINYYYVLILVH